MNPQPGFAIILNRIRYEGSLPFEVAPGLLFDHATRREAVEIAHFIAAGGFAPFGELHDFTAIPREPGETGSYTYQHVPLEDVKFWVLRFDTVHGFQKWDLPFQLIDSEIEWAAFLYKGGRNADPPKAFHYFQTNHLPYYTDMNESDLKGVQEIESRLETMQLEKASKPAAASVLRIIDNFRASRAYIRIGEMAYMSHFTILEGLLTHNPTGIEDSLSHQLSTKIPLLFGRMDNPPNHSTDFPGIELGALWKKLYAVRSAIAHGSGLDFKSPKFAVLRDFQVVHRYVYASMKALLRFALREPQLVYDLRAC
jgi:Apea-like HEPN